MIIRFGPYEVDLTSGQLRKFGYRVKLQPKSFLVLEALLDAPGEMVTREELKTRLWPENTFVEFESSLNVAVRRLREALSDEAQNPAYIETVPRRGYRFLGSMERIEVPAAGRKLSLAVAGATSDAVGDVPLLLPQSWMARNFWKLMAPVMAMLLMVAGMFLWRRSVAASSAVPSSIAVLPFADMSPEKNQNYFSDGLAEELLNQLAKTPGLRVAARTSSFQFRDKINVAAIGRQLDVGTILEGSVRKEGNRVRIAAELVKAADGFQLWSGTYDRNLNDVFAVQDEIARAITSELKVRLLKSNTAEAPQHGTTAEAYNAYLQGRYYYERRTQDDLAKAYEYFQQAVKSDPSYARAWSALAWVLIAQAEAAYGPSFQEGYRTAQAAAEKALQLDPGLAEAHAAVGRIKRGYDWDSAGADTAFQKALALEPQNSVVLLGASSLDATLGRFDEAVALNRRAVEIDPLERGGAHIDGNARLLCRSVEYCDRCVSEGARHQPGRSRSTLSARSGLYFSRTTATGAGRIPEGRAEHPAQRRRSTGICGVRAQSGSGRVAAAAHHRLPHPGRLPDCRGICVPRRNGSRLRVAGVGASSQGFGAARHQRRSASKESLP